MKTQWIGDLASILRFHIILVAMAAAVVFGWIFSGEYLVAVALLGGLDWMLINLLNKISDIEEDTANAIRGTDHLVRHKRRFVVGWWALLAASMGVGYLLYPELSGYRALVQLIGIGYSYPIVPTPNGFKRFKEIYFLKNFMSSVLFVLTVFVYPLVVSGAVVSGAGIEAGAGLSAVIVLALFFVTFELTYEILYDLRDLEGDRLAGIPTYPVVHGPERARQIIDGLLAFSAVALSTGLLLGVVGIREALMLAAPAVQFFWYRARYTRGLTSADCIRLTHMGTAMLLLFLLGTALWREAGLPENIYIELLGTLAPGR